MEREIGRYTDRKLKKKPLSHWIIVGTQYVFHAGHQESSLPQEEAYEMVLSRRQ